MIKIEVSVKTGASHTQVLRLSDGRYKVSVGERPFEGRANEAVIEAVADHFSVAKSRVIIRRGFKNKKKFLEIGS
ncbi:MAG: DUF167 domain-containing protein [Candidatus Omnitrophota bacterium]